MSASHSSDGPGPFKLISSPEMKVLLTSWHVYITPSPNRCSLDWQNSWYSGHLQPRKKTYLGLDNERWY